ncbi:hypothetical protein BOX15_Mlig013691g1, partial [Macrostomum lignano]
SLLSKEKSSRVVKKPTECFLANNNLSKKLRQHRPLSNYRSLYRSSMPSSPSKKYDLDLAYQKEKVHTCETQAIRYTDLSRMIGRNFNQIFEQSMTFDDDDDQQQQGQGEGCGARRDASQGDLIQGVSSSSDQLPSNSGASK